MLVSTVSPELMVVLSDYGCSTSVFPNAPSDCAVSRGTLFNANQSTSWYDLGLFSISQDGVSLEASLGYYQNAEFALETLDCWYDWSITNNPKSLELLLELQPEPVYL